MKKSITYCLLLTSIFFVVLPENTNAQRRPHIENLPKYDLRPYHFGFSLCLNKMDFAIHPVPNYHSFDSLFAIHAIPQWGFNIGIVSNLRIFEYGDLRFLPTLSFGTRILDYTLKTKNKLTETKRLIEFNFS